MNPKNRRERGGIALTLSLLSLLSPAARAQQPAPAPADPAVILTLQQALRQAL